MRTDALETIQVLLKCLSKVKCISQYFLYEIQGPISSTGI